MGLSCCREFVIFMKKRRSVRLKGYDYSQEGMYFVTICVQGKECLFGIIRRGTACCDLNEYGMIVREELELTQSLRKNVFLDEYVIMPNHIHMIFVIDDNKMGADTIMGTARCTRTESKFGNIMSGSLSVIVRSFKSAVTKRINLLRDTVGEKVWQRNYYEHIIREDKDLNRIREYIINNPKNWEIDELYKENT